MAEDYMKKMEENRNALKAANAANKEAVFDALQAAKITHVEVGFDGEGDSGGMIDKTAHCGEAVVSIPPALVKLKLVEYYGSKTSQGTKPLEEAIEVLCFDYIGQEGNSGWENNEGAFGTFRFDVAKRSVALEFNQRIADVSHFTYQF